MKFFDRFPEFDYDPRESIGKNFERLAWEKEWSKKKTKDMRAECYGEAFEELFAQLEITSQLDKLKHLCVELGIVPADSVTKCKKALRKVKVNIFDLVDARNNNKEVKKFKSYNALVDYTRKTGRFFPLRKAKGDVIKVLLKRIL